MATQLTGPVMPIKTVSFNFLEIPLEPIMCYKLRWIIMSSLEINGISTAVNIELAGLCHLTFMHWLSCCQ